MMPVHAQDNLGQDLTQYTLRFSPLPFFFFPPCSLFLMDFKRKGALVPPNLVTAAPMCAVLSTGEGTTCRCRKAGQQRRAPPNAFEPLTAGFCSVHMARVFLIWVCFSLLASSANLPASLKPSSIQCSSFLLLKSVLWLCHSNHQFGPGELLDHTWPGRGKGMVLLP